MQKLDKVSLPWTVVVRGLVGPRAPDSAIRPGASQRSFDRDLPRTNELNFGREQRFGRALREHKQAG